MVISLLIRFSSASKGDRMEGPCLWVTYEDKDKKTASYTEFDLCTKCEGDLFVNNIKLTYTTNNIDTKAHELIFMVPLPPNAIVKFYSVKIGKGPCFKSVVYPNFIGEKTYTEAKVDETCGKAELTDDIFTISMKIPIQTIKGDDIVFKLLWQQFAIQNYHPQHGLCYEYVFPIQSYFKYGSHIDRTKSNFLRNEYGFAYPSIVVDISDCHFELVDFPSNFKKIENEMKYEFHLEEGESHDNMRFRFINKKTQVEPFELFKFSYDGYNVFGVTLIPHLSSILNGLDTEREIIIVVDKSGSMSYCIDGITPYRIVGRAINHILTACADTKIHVNLVVFDDSVDPDSDILFKKSQRITTPGLLSIDKTKNEYMCINTVKDSIESREMIIPDGGTNILAGLKEAAKLKRIKNAQGHIIQRNIILLTDGGDSNLSKIRDFVKKETSNNDVRFFSVGIGNGVSFDIIETVGNMGRGTSNYVWDLKEVGYYFTEIIKRTCIDPINFVWDFATSKKSVFSVVKNGMVVLGDPNETFCVPSYVSNYSIFPTRTTSLFCIQSKEIPEFIEFKINGKRITKRKEDAKELSLEAESIIKELFSIEIDKMLNAEFKKCIEGARCEKMFEKSFFSGKDKAELKKDLEKCFKNQMIFEKYIEKVDFSVSKQILNQDTLLMAGDEIKRDLEWKKIEGVEKLIFNQLYKNLEEEFNSDFKRICTIQTDCHGPTRSSFSLKKSKTNNSSIGTGIKFLDDNSGERITISSFVFESITNILESDLSLKELFEKLRKFVKDKLGEEMAIKLEEIIVATKNLKYSDAGKKKYLIPLIYSTFVENPDPVQSFIIMQKNHVALNNSD